MSQILLLIICLLSGFLLRRTSLFDQESPIVLNKLIIYFFIPVLTLYHVPRIEFQISLIWLSITPFLVYIGSWLYIKAVSRVRKMDHLSEGALIMTSGIGSTSFVGFPIFDILYGEEGLAYGIILSLAGTIFVFNTMGVATGIYYSDDSGSYRQFLKRLLSFPPLIAFLVALIINLVDVSIPVWFVEVLGKLSAPFSVIALLTIGMQIDLKIDKSFLRYLLIGQSYKLMLAPLMMYGLMYHVLGQRDELSDVIILGAGIGSMNAVSIVAAQMGLNPRLSIFIPALSIPFSIPVLFFIDFLLH